MENALETRHLGIQSLLILINYYKKAEAKIQNQFLKNFKTRLVFHFIKCQKVSIILI